MLQDKSILLITNMTNKDQGNPEHYKKNFTGIECIEIVELMPFNIGTAIKYLWRAGLKDDVVLELKKAKWYVDRHIKHIIPIEPSDKLKKYSIKFTNAMSFAECDEDCPEMIYARIIKSLAFDSITKLKAYLPIHFRSISEEIDSLIKSSEVKKS